MELRVPLYRDLLKVTELVRTQAKQVAEQLRSAAERPVMAFLIVSEIEHFLELSAKVVGQTTRRVLEGQSVPATEKIVSIFEPHTDIIVKDRRDTHYGHKICLTTGASGLVLDCTIEKGNPADSTLARRMIERVKMVLGKTPRQVTFDGGFSSKVNVKDIKALGVGDVAFSKHVGLKVTDMVKSEWVMKKLRNFRAGIEGNISFIKRCFGLNRCT